MSRFFQDLSIMIRANLWLVPVLALLVTGLLYFVAPPPPMSATMATGFAGGAYRAFAEQLQSELAKDGFELKLVDSSGSRQNSQLLLDPDAGVQIALLQSGQETQLTDEARAQLNSLGAVYLEPVWLFMREDVDLDSLQELDGLRLAVGNPEGGLRMLIGPVLKASGLEPEQQTNWLPFTGQRAFDQLRAGQLDGAFFMGAAESELIQQLAPAPNCAYSPLAGCAPTPVAYPFCRV